MGCGKAYLAMSTSDYGIIGWDDPQEERICRMQYASGTTESSDPKRH